MLNAPYTLYYSDDQQKSIFGFNCLYAYLEDELVDTDVPYVRNYHLIPYCRRLDQNDEEKEEEFSKSSYENVQNTITFADLYRQGVTSTQLLHWSIPIDIAERYEADGENSKESFYNCSLPWFGSRCQYRFKIDILSSFSDFLKFIDINRYPHFGMIRIENQACYPFLTSCYRYRSWMCFGWREICDGKFDCLNGEDEEFCQLLEINECATNEYRCHYGGQCIPSEFVNDGKYSIDCLDATDEINQYEILAGWSQFCINTLTFQCQEFIFRYRPDKRISSILIDSFKYITDLECRRVFICVLHMADLYQNKFLWNSNNCTSLLNQRSSGCFAEHCPFDWLVFPEHTIIFELFQFVYLTNRSIIDFENNITPDFICFNASRCPASVSCLVDIGIHNGLHCCRTNDLTDAKLISLDDLTNIVEDLIRQCLTKSTNQTCSHPSLFHCPLSSKCISKHRLVDGENDCYFGEDESFPACQLNDSLRFVCESESNKCLSMIAVRNGKKDCQNGEDEWSDNERNIRRGKIPFGLFCDGENDLLSMNISNETDESHCEWWPCDTPNVRCDNTWHCLNGNDELNCPGSTCSSNELKCIFGLSSKYKCVSPLHLVEIYSLCDDSIGMRMIYMNNESYNYSMNYFLWNETKCISGEQLFSCQPLLPKAYDSPCLMDTKIVPADAIFVQFENNPGDQNGCALSSLGFHVRHPKKFLTTSRLGYLPSPSTSISTRQTMKFETGRQSRTNMDVENWLCDHGIDIVFQSNDTYACICPPNYFGDKCQWQNQRISLTLHFVYQTDTYTNSVFQVIIMIIDQQEEITPYHERILYVPKRDCNTKFNIYLLYPNRPKNSSVNYSIRIDIYDKIQLKYWSSWYLSIPFQFLPVNRISAQLFIPTKFTQIESSCLLSCGIHGRCRRYINTNASYFCQCDEDYSGLKCDKKENCSCSSGSFCLISSICICPLTKFGRKCYLNHSICHSSINPCLNNGLCVPFDDRINIDEYQCLCKEGFHGKKCEYLKNRINIELTNEILKTTSALLIHFISAAENTQHEQTTIFKKIIYGQNQITILILKSFNFVFIELLNQTYYLIILREKFVESEDIQTKLISNQYQRCSFINELLNKTFQSYSYLHRIKYYPLLCRQNQELKCFYDEYYMCICDLDRFSNCFFFNFNRTFNCSGNIHCQNNGQCFQSNIECITKSICVCSDCFYGTKCQFSTKGLVLSLDYILAYHIKPNISVFEQPTIIINSIIIITIMFIVGLINGILSISTFRTEKIREIGSGLYLFVASWISIFTIFILLFKFWQLILSQMAILTNRSFLWFNCILLDVTINVFLTTNDWLDACVSIERVIELIKEANFNKSKSKQIAKWIIISIFIVTILTFLPDPFYRHLTDDINEDEQRTWCLIRQTSSSIETFNQFMTFFHFLTPLSINLISIVIMIIFLTHFHSTIDPRLTFRQHLQLQIKEHKHHLITLLALIVLALPRLIISFMSGCIKSPNHSSFFLSGYLIAFLPSILTSIVFILPWKEYKHESSIIIKRMTQRFRRRRIE